MIPELRLLLRQGRMDTFAGACSGMEGWRAGDDRGVGWRGGLEWLRIGQAAVRERGAEARVTGGACQKEPEAGLHAGVGEGLRVDGEEDRAGARGDEHATGGGIEGEVADIEDGNFFQPEPGFAAVLGEIAGEVDTVAGSDPELTFFREGYGADVFDLGGQADGVPGDAAVAGEGGAGAAG